MRQRCHTAPPTYGGNILVTNKKKRFIGPPCPRCGGPTKCDNTVEMDLGNGERIMAFRYDCHECDYSFSLTGTVDSASPFLTTD